MKDFLQRRDFLKLALSSTAIGLSLPKSLGATTWMSEDKFVRTVCEMCSSRCSMEARVIDGRGVLLQGNAYDKSIGTRLCARGVAGLSQLYDHERLTKPLIRTGKRGENQWKEVSFDEALDFVASKLAQIKETYGAQSVLFSAKTGEQYRVLRSFASLFGSPNIFSHWSSCPIAIESAFEHTFGERLHRDFENATYILNFGHNLFEGIDVPLTRAMAHFSANPSKKLVVFDPRFSIMASKADVWYPIRAGSDVAFVLSLIHVLIRDGRYDKAFIETYTTGFEHLIHSTKETTPQWQSAYTGIEASVVEKIAVELHQAAPRCIIDWGHKSTTSPAEYHRSRAILMLNLLMGNVEKEGGIYFAKTAERINTIAHEMIAPVLNDPYPKVEVTQMRLDGAGEKNTRYRFVPKRHGVLQAIPEAILSQEPYPLKAWFLSRHNPLITVAHPQKMKEAMETLEFIVVNDIYMSDTAMMADVILPEASYLERDESIGTSYLKTPTYTMRNRAIVPLVGLKSAIEIVRDIAERMGLGHHYAWKSVPELRAYQAKGDSVLLEKLLKRGIATFDIPELFLREKRSVERFCERFPKAFEKGKEEACLSYLFPLKTPSGKIEIFCESVEKAFHGFGVPQKSDMDVYKGYPYVLTSGKSAIHTNGHTQNVPYLNQLLSSNPVWMHPSTAKAHGLKMGETFYLQNGVSKEKATVFITEGIRPDTLFAYMGFGVESAGLTRAKGKGLNLCKLLSLDTASVCGSMITNIGVNIIKA